MIIGRGRWITGDTFEAMATLPDESVDMILCDLPYGTTACAWDSVLPLDKLWSEYWRIAKPRAAIVLTAQVPFSSVLGASQIKYLKYEWVWEKTAATGFMNARKMPLKSHENILVFYKSLPTYNPQKTIGHERITRAENKTSHGDNYGVKESRAKAYDSTERYPRSVLLFAKDNRLTAVHPTQKPADLFEYMIRTYTDEGMTVLDNTAGSGTTAIAAERSNRRWICIERDEEYSAKAIARITAELEKTR